MNGRSEVSTASRHNTIHFIMADFSSIINAVPPVTRTLLLATAVITL